MRELLDKIVTFLSSSGYGSIGTTLFKAEIPTTPTVCIAVRATGGPIFASDPLRRLTFQLLHRNTHVSSGSCLVDSLHALLNDNYGFLDCQIPGRVTAEHEPGIFFRDQNNYPVFTLNYTFYTSSTK